MLDVKAPNRLVRIRLRPAMPKVILFIAVLLLCQTAVPQCCVYNWKGAESACWVSQVAALPPKTLERRTAISGEIPRFSLTNSDRVVRVTPRAAAACVMVKPSGSMHWRSTKPPGCGGFFIGIVKTPSVVVDVVDIHGVTFREAENHAPVGANRYRPKAFEITPERM